MTIIGILVPTVLTLLFWKTSINTVEYVWLFRWAILLLGFSLFVFKRRSVLIGWVIANGIAFASFPIYSGLDKKILFSLKYAALSGVVTVLVSVLALAAIQRKELKWLFYTLFFAAVVLATGVFLAPNPTLKVPFMGNPSITGTYIALIAVALGWPGLIFLPSLILIKAATPLFVLFVGLAYRYRRYLPWYGPICVGLFIVAFYSKLGHGNGRYEVWKLSLDYFFTQHWTTWLFGTGLGSTPVLVPMIQVSHGVDPTSSLFFMYLHNDWLQILFELGFVGLVAALLTLGWYWKQATPPVRATLVAFGVAMLTNFPLHSPLLALAGMVFVLHAAYQKESYVC